MASLSANGVTVEYLRFGDPRDPPLVLVAGLGGQLVSWDDDFVATLVARGLQVVTFDNRDVGRSTWMDAAGRPDVLDAMAGRTPVPYLVEDMADDTAGLIAGLGWEAAHVLGVSMGAMIAQALAIRHPGRVRSLVSVMSTTGASGVGAPRPEAVEVLLRPAPEGRHQAVEQAVASARVIGSPGFPFPEDRIRRQAAVAYDRAFHPAGAARQAVAIVCSPDRTAGLGRVGVPTLVVHGEDDPLVDVSGGRATAAAVAGARLWTVPGMGHDIPAELYPALGERVARLCAESPE